MDENSYLIKSLAQFTQSTSFDDLPSAVVDECIRIILDSVGCALAGTTHPRGKKAVDYARLIGGSPEATILGIGERVSVFGAAFANGELINALDYDAILPPGHVCPYVLPGALAVAEAAEVSGKALIVATAIAHEMSNRIGKAMDYHRDIKDGKVSPPAVWGFSSTIFGATAGIGKIKGFSEDVLGNALALAASVSPVNSAAAWREHKRPTTIKYALAGLLCQSALTAAYMAELGHRGDLEIMEPEFGYPRFIGTTRWEPERITHDLGATWGFPTEQSYKPYPHCRILHAPLDALLHIVEKHGIKPEEIESVEAWVEAWVERPLWLNRSIEDVTDAQFSMAHGLALAAHRITPGSSWQSPEVVYQPSITALMDKITFRAHPDYVASVTSHAAARPARIEVRARGTSFVEERSYPKGTPSAEPTTYFTTDELAEKLLANTDGVVPRTVAMNLLDALLNLSSQSNVAKAINHAAEGPNGRAAWKYEIAGKAP